MKLSRSLVWLLLACSAASHAACPPPGYERSDLLDLREQGFVIEDPAARDAMAIALTDCLGDPDPGIRDGVVFEGLSKWMREGALGEPTLQRLYLVLLEHLASQSDPEGFEQPFAALVLSELARTDRVAPWMSLEQRQGLVDAAASYLAGVTDYRGFSGTEGWRHGVAHGSDIVLQLALNEAIGADALRKLMDAVAKQVAPPGEHFYIYGEPGRLARAVFYAYRRDVIPAAEWEAWFDRISQPQPLESWGQSFSSQQGLAKRHNTLAFLVAQHLNASIEEDEQAERLAELVLAAIRKVVGG